MFHKPSFALWVLTIFFSPTLILLLLQIWFYLSQRKTVGNRGAFRRVKDEVED